MRGSVFVIAWIFLLFLMGAATLLLNNVEVSAIVGPTASSHYVDLIEKGVGYLTIILSVDVIILIGVVILLLMPGRSNSLPAHQIAGGGKKVARQSVTENGMLVMCILLACILRVIELNSGLWIDEYLTLSAYMQKDLFFTVTSFKDDNQHWLFSVLAKISIDLFGEYPWSFRLPAVVFGILSVWATYRLGLLIFDSRIAFFGAFLLTVSYHHIWYSQNARGYTILLFGTILSVEFLYKALVYKQRRYWVYYAFALALSVGGHLTGVFLGFGHFVVVLWLQITHRTTLAGMVWPLGSFLIAAWITLHLFAVLIPQMSAFFLQSDSSGAVVHSFWENPIWALTEIFGGIGDFSGLLYFVVPVALVVCLLCLYICWKKNQVFLWLVSMPVVFLIATMILMGRNLWPRLLFSTAGFVVLYISYLVFLIFDYLASSDKAGIRNIRYIPVAVGGLLFISSTISVYSYPKQDFESARDFLINKHQEGDAIVALHMAGVVYSENYHFTWPVANTVFELQQSESSDGDTWVVYTLPAYIRNSRTELYRELKDNYKLVMKFPGTLGDGEILILKRI